jgi:transcriptional regulator with XRE-family HTH domain
MERHDHPDDLKLLVRVLRELRGWDQMKLATEAGLDPSSISHYETGRTVPPRKTLERLAAAVGLPLPFVESSLLPALSAARAMAAPSSAESCSSGSCDDLEPAMMELGRALTAAGRSTVAAFLARLDSIDQAWERTGLPAPEDRIAASDLWKRLEPRSAEERRFLVESCREFQLWALAERLCHESEKAADRPDHALELAWLAHCVAKLVPGEEAWRSRLEGYVLGFLAGALRLGGDLPGAEETTARARQLWEAGADPAGLLVPRPQNSFRVSAPPKVVANGLPRIRRARGSGGED